MSLLDNLQWRYATKKYDPSRKVGEEEIKKIVEAARLAPTSSGLQQFRVIVISNQELKEKIVPIAKGQQTVADCSHLLVFAAWDKYTEERIDSIFNRITEERSLPPEQFKNYTDMLKSVYLNQSADENFVHTARQAYIGFALAIAEAAELKIDSTPMEGFDSDQLDELLNLREKGLRSVTILAVGYRDAENDWLVNMKKVRNPSEEFALELK
ncbi:nitroreductase [Arcticibacter tournemirensis]|uniref:NAD(P)H-dependent oxidoreductase n=1 Tax=Arcticibacter tournemirensis TaxID=699437 RepID=A0A4V1KIR2_9SPHI|nr:NAD(P)H-dependent oxidoreductase [Arcticibacter tournemirensis]KAA8481410.1 NAD(P)H-dependent oxidoreductase [Arcticibacter tournemirensis]RXF71582.1 NAD(P)H-dependent oxidoreductase [Arcticibacter tournemirensis]TQM48995.1 nitroreductase [Arcticibacter tournemirensis]